MPEVAVLGKPEFTLGFQLAGVRKVFEVKNNAKEQILSVLQSPGEIGVVILDQESFDALDAYEKRDVEDSIKPVFVVLSEEESDKNLQRMIKKSIGVDIWEK